MKEKLERSSGINTRHKPYVIGKASTSGITLIALIVTIVVLIILAVISVNLLMNGNIIGRAEQSKDIQAKATELERLELVKGDVAIDNKGKVTVDDYIEEAIKQGITTEDEVEDNGDGSKNIITDNGWNVNIAPDPDNENNVIITIEGKGNELPPRITKLELTRNEAKTELTATIEVKRGEGATYKYYYKTEKGTYKLAHEGTETTWTITNGISVNEFYTVKVEAINQYGMKYKEMSEKDETAPSATITLSARGVQKGVGGTARIVQTDNESGVDIEKCKWVLNTEKENIGTEENKYSGTFTNTTENIPTKSDTEGTYYLHVLTVDKQGNKKETVSKSVKVGTLVTTITNTSHEKNIKAIDKNGNQVVVPNGFKYALGNTVQDGIVIQDVNGNEFVWIPVSNINANGSNPIVKDDDTEIEITLGRYDNFKISDEGKYIPKQKGSEYSFANTNNRFTIDPYYSELNINGRESTQNGTKGSTNSTAKNLGEFVTSVANNKGYYFARYEASYGSGSEFGVGNNSSYYKPLSKISTSFSDSSMVYSRGTLWNFITQGNASKVCKNMYYGNSYVESDLVNSYMWDTTVIYINAMNNNDYHTKTRGTNTTLKNTGKTGDVQCQIYDMAGNVEEWNTEYSSLVGSYLAARCCMYRGGSFSDSTNNHPVSFRNDWSDTSAFRQSGFRCGLYCK